MREKLGAILAWIFIALGFAISLAISGGYIIAAFLRSCGGKH